MALGSRFGEQVCRIAALGQQLWRTALGHNFGEQRQGQLWVATLGNNFGQLSRPAGSFGQQQLWEAAFRSFGATALGHNFGEQRRGTALGSSFGEQLWTAFRTSFEAASGNNIGVWGSVFGTRLSVLTLKSSFGEQLWGAILRL